MERYSGAYKLCVSNIIVDEKWKRKKGRMKEVGETKNE